MTDEQLVAHLDRLRSQRNPKWLAARTQRASVNRKNRPGRSWEHAQALLEDSLRTSQPSTDAV